MTTTGAMGAVGAGTGTFYVATTSGVSAGYSPILSVNTGVVINELGSTS